MRCKRCGRRCRTRRRSTASASTRPRSAIRRRNSRTCFARRGKPDSAPSRTPGRKARKRTAGRNIMHRDNPASLAAAQGPRRADRVIRAPRGTQRTAKSWLTEAPLRMLMNNLDPEVAENPQELVVYGGIGRAARNWECYDAIVAALRELNDDETLLVQSGKPVGVFRTHADAPRVLIANSNLVPHWATLDHFNALDRKGLMMFGQMTAGSWIYIGSQGIVQGTYETFVEIGRRHFGGSLL